MPSKLRNALGLSAATVVAATGLVALPSTASAGVTCETTRDNTPVHAEPWPAAPIINRLPNGTLLDCTEGPGWFRVGRDGQWLGYVHANFLDTSFG
jgi:hypothetical protein